MSGDKDQNAAIEAAADAVHLGVRAVGIDLGMRASRAAAAAVWPIVAAAVRVEALTEAADAIEEHARMRIGQFVPVTAEWTIYHDGMYAAAGLVRGLAAKEPTE